MKLSTRGHYGMLAMVDLARQFGSGPLSLAQIAFNEDISLEYLEQLVGALRRAGLVESKRGAHGGYVLARAPSEVTVGEIMRALEGPIEPVACLADGEAGECCGRGDDCPSRTIWSRVRDTVVETLDCTTLADML